MIVFIPYPPRKYCVSSTVRLVFKALFHIVNSSNAVFGRMWSSGSPFRTRHPIDIKGTYYNKFIWEGVLQPRIYFNFMKRICMQWIWEWIPRVYLVYPWRQEVHQSMLFPPSAIRYHQALILAERSVRPFHSSHKAIVVEISNIVSIHIVITKELNLRTQIMLRKMSSYRQSSFNVVVSVYRIRLPNNPNIAPGFIFQLTTNLEKFVIYCE